MFKRMLTASSTITYPLSQAAVPRPGLHPRVAGEGCELRGGLLHPDRVLQPGVPVAELGAAAADPPQPLHLLRHLHLQEVPAGRPVGRSAHHGHEMTNDTNSIDAIHRCLKLLSTMMAMNRDETNESNTY